MSAQRVPPRPGEPDASASGPQGVGRGSGGYPGKSRLIRKPSAPQTAQPSRDPQAGAGDLSEVGSGGPLPEEEIQLDPEGELGADPEGEPGAEPEGELGAEPEGEPGADPEGELGAEPEGDLNAELQGLTGSDDVPGKPVRDLPSTVKVRSTPLGRKSSGSAKGRRTPLKRSMSQSNAQGGRHRGAEIGRLQRRGLSLAVKFSIFISILIFLITTLFGLVIIKIFKSKLESEIQRTGYNQILALVQVGRDCHDYFEERHKEALRNKQSYRPSDYAASEHGQNLRNALKAIVDGDSRVYDIFIMVPRNFGEPTEYPSVSLMAVKTPRAYSMAKDLITLDVPNVDGQVRVWLGDYRTADGAESPAKEEKGKTGDATAEKTEQVYFFSRPILLQGGRPLATINLILSRQEIDDEVRSLLFQIGLFGLIFIGAGILFSLFLASAVTSPLNSLIRDMDIVARGDLDHETRSVSSDEVGLLATAFNRMTHNLRDARNKDREVERLNSEVRLAQEIHARLLPSKTPNLPGYDIHTCYYPAKEVGGDYYDFIPVDQENLAIVVADVSGKGIPGSMVMGTTRTILQMMASTNQSPADVLSKTNHWVSRDIKRGMFVTCMYVILNVRKRILMVASAGHNPMIIWRAATRTCEQLRPNGIALGFDKGPIFNRTIREAKVQLFRGDRVVMYTDGVVECMNEDHQEWGDDTLCKFVAQNAELSSKELMQQLNTELRRHQGKAEQHDDITVTTFRIE